MATPAPHLVDEILEEIFLRLPTPAELARVSTACPRFHRIITERAFLRRLRKLHPPPLLGFAYRTGFLHVEAPHPSAPLACAFADAADFTYSFLPKCIEEFWAPCDARDGRVLLEDRSRRFGRRASFAILAVCYPLSRRYVLLPPTPKEMTAQQDCLVDLGPKLAPIGEDEDDTSFKVVCTAEYISKLMVYVFCSITGQWCIAASTSFSSLGIAEPHGEFCSNYVGGCLYWADLWRDKLLILDTGIMEFSTIDVLTGYHVQLRNQPGLSVCKSTIVDGTKGALEMLTLARDDSSNSFYVYHTTQQNNGESSNEWQLKNVMELPRLQLYFTADAIEGFLFLRNVPYQLDDKHTSNLFSLEFKTFELEKVCMSACGPYNSYFGFPPSLSKTNSMSYKAVSLMSQYC